MEAGGEGRWPRVLGSLLCQVSLDRARKVTPCTRSLESALWKMRGFQSLAPVTIVTVPSCVLKVVHVPGLLLSHFIPPEIPWGRQIIIPFYSRGKMRLRDRVTCLVDTGGEEVDSSLQSSVRALHSLNPGSLGPSLSLFSLWTSVSPSIKWA